MADGLLFYYVYYALSILFPELIECSRVDLIEWSFDKTTAAIFGAKESSVNPKIDIHDLKWKASTNYLKSTVKTV